MKPKQLSKVNSIYVSSGLIIFLSVLMIMSISTFFSYLTEKKKIDQEIKTSVLDSMHANEAHIMDLIASYSVNEYSKFIESEVQHRQFFAMIVEDHNMGQLVGQVAYIKGKIRNHKGQIVEFDPNNQAQLHQLQNIYYSLEQELKTKQGKVLGQLRIAVSDYELHNRLNQLLIRNLLTTLSISALLISTLFFLMRSNLFRPLTEIIRSLSDHDKDGFPLNYAPVKGPNEVQKLSETINHMIKETRLSRQQLLEKSHDLQREKERFQLAVDGTQDGLWDWNLQTNKVYFSERYATMLGFQVGELGHQENLLNELIHPDDFDKAQYEMNNYLQSKGRETYESTFRMRSKSGEWRWVTARGKALFNEFGSPIRFIGFNTDVTKTIQQQEELREQKNIQQYLANHDSLTNLANRTLFNDRLLQAINQAKRQKNKLALLFIDLDYFKEINDSLGHEVGDTVIQTLSRRLKKMIRGGDTLARLGGDEFTVLMNNVHSGQNASRLAEAIINDFHTPLQVLNHELHLGCSIGISIYPENGENPTDLLKNADAAMYRAKNLGRNNFQYYSKEMTEEAFERLNMEANIRTGIQNEEFEVYYQPQVNAQEERITGMEALVRWNSPTLGFVTPNRFIPVAVSTGSIIDLDRYVMQKAVKEFGNWCQAGLNPSRLSMNLNMKQLHREDFIDFLRDLVANAGFDASCIELEVTEGELMENPERSIEMLRQIEQLGITLSLDDFGTGYSSLSYLKKLPISKLKIDRSFVRDLPDDKEDEAIVHAIIALASSLNLDILAEGTETLEQVKMLNKMGCHNFQGFYFAKPLPASDMKQFLKKWHH